MAAILEPANEAVASMSVRRHRRSRSLASARVLCFAFGRGSHLRKIAATIAAFEGLTSSSNTAFL